MKHTIHFVYQQLSQKEKNEIIQFWIMEGALNKEQADKRVDQVVMVAKDEDGRILGVSTILKYVYKPIGQQFWFFRAFVGAKSRHQGIALQFTLEVKSHLNQRFEEGKDSDVVGILMKVESPILKKTLPQGTWKRSQFHFVGKENDAHVRISYFENATIS